MKPIPGPELYEQELVYWPYRKSLAKVKEFVCANVPRDGILLDLMCGPGYLLGEIKKERSDLHLMGVDIDQNYISYAKKKYPNIAFEVGDVLDWEIGVKFDSVICTGALHHIHYQKQDVVVGKMARFLKKDGFALVSDCYTDQYKDETQRKVAAAKLGYEYLVATIRNNAPDDVISVAADVLCNDVLMDEFKGSLNDRLLIFAKHFGRIRTKKVWPHPFEDIGGYGDYITKLKHGK